MSEIEALVLGLIQGLTEYLPVSSSGHLTIGAALFGINGEDNLTFTVAVHVATVLSTLVILWKEIAWIFKGLFAGKMNDETRYVVNILVSMIPVGIVGVFFKDKVEEVFGSGLFIVGCMLLLTATLLAFSYWAKPRQRENISPWHAFVIGIGLILDELLIRREIRRQRAEGQQGADHQGLRQRERQQIGQQEIAREGVETQPYQRGRENLAGDAQGGRAPYRLHQPPLPGIPSVQDGEQQ